MKIVLPQNKQAKKARKLLKDILLYIGSLPLIGILAILIGLSVKLFFKLSEDTRNIIVGISVGLLGSILFFVFGSVLCMLIYDGFFSNDDLENKNG